MGQHEQKSLLDRAFVDDDTPDGRGEDSADSKDNIGKVHPCA